MLWLGKEAAVRRGEHPDRPDGPGERVGQLVRHLVGPGSGPALSTEKLAERTRIQAFKYYKPKRHLINTPVAPSPAVVRKPHHNPTRNLATAESCGIIGSWGSCARSESLYPNEGAARQRAQVLKQRLCSASVLCTILSELTPLYRRSPDPRRRQAGQTVGRETPLNQTVDRETPRSCCPPCPRLLCAHHAPH